MTKFKSISVMFLASITYGLLWLMTQMLKGTEQACSFIQHKAGPVLPKLKGVINHERSESAKAGK